MRIFIEVALKSSYNKAMAHGKTSCRNKRLTLLRIELAQLYAQRTAVDAAIQELEVRRITVNSSPESSLQKQNSDFSSKTVC